MLSKLAFALVFSLVLVSKTRGYTTSLALDESRTNHQRCIDMMGGGSRTFRPESQASLMVTFAGHSQGLVSIVLFELGDEHLGGVRLKGSNEKEVLCTEENIQRGLCGKSQLGEFLISDSARREARHPLFTRAVNLSMPGSLHYPVSGPGLYCAAAVGFSASSFSAMMLAIDPSSGGLPAFRVGLLKAYRYLGPVWILLAVLWTLHLLDERDKRPCWLVPLSAVQIGLRWALLEVGHEYNDADGVTRAFKIAGGAIEVAQDFAVVLHAQQLMMTEDTRIGPTTPWTWPWPWPNFIGLLVLGVGLTAMRWAEMTTSTATSRATVYCNAVLGSALFVYMTISILTFKPSCRRLAGQRLSPPISAALAVLLALIWALFSATAAFNIWCLVQPLKPLEFGQRFWSTRFLTIDMPFDIISLCCVCCVSLYCQCRRRGPLQHVGEAGDELGKLGDSAEQ
ncbi:hypothetical protein EsDP_00005983 [Epichloe bromicola]|uniref:PTM1-like N-terminal domain-containing protein n=1 Tax=Epichloe bromicola TaxID=79588 RepID=A0ABQ0CWA3_9HYPO